MNKSVMRTTLRTLLATYILTGILLVLLAFALYKLHLKESQIKIGVNAIYVATCFLGGLMMGKAMGRRRFFWGLLLGLLYFLVLFLVSMALNRGLKGDWNTILTALAICGASGTAGGMVS